MSDTPAQRVLFAIRSGGPSTAAEIARAIGTGGVAARAHLRALEAAGFVRRAVERRPVGRPVSRFHLTPRAEERFPKRYDFLANRLIEAIVSERGAEGLERILQRWEDGLHETLDASLPAEPRARLAALAAHQNAYGFMAEARDDESGVALVERNCPILAVAARHPEICRHEAALFGRTLRWKTALVACQATGDQACVFRIGRSRAKAGARSADGTSGGKD